MAGRRSSVKRLSTASHSGLSSKLSLAFRLNHLVFFSLCIAANSVDSKARKRIEELFELTDEIINAYNEINEKYVSQIYRKYEQIKAANKKLKETLQRHHCAGCQCATTQSNTNEQGGEEEEEEQQEEEKESSSEEEDDDDDSEEDDDEQQQQQATNAALPSSTTNSIVTRSKKNNRSFNFISFSSTSIFFLLQHSSSAILKKPKISMETIVDSTVSARANSIRGKTKHHHLRIC